MMGSENRSRKSSASTSASVSTISNNNDDNDDRNNNDNNEPVSEAIVDTNSTIDEPRSFGFYLYRYLYLGFFATLNVPFLGMALHLIFYFTCWSVFGQVLWFKTLLILYLVYTVLDPSPTRGGYSLSWWTHARMEQFRKMWFLQHFCDYFPARLHPSVPLPPDQGPYIFLYHPHGVIGIGACATLMTNAAGFDQIFPNIPRRAITLNACFLIPLYREFMLALGVVSANKQTLTTVLQRQESIVLLPGGATEALYAQPGTFALYLQRRKGFVKLALETGAKLVPVLGFGENEVFHLLCVKDKASWAAQLQSALCKLLTFSLPLLMSPLPRAQPIHVVVGKPVAFDQVNEKDFTKSVNNYHAKYIQAVKDMYEEHKTKYGHEQIPLVIH